MEVDNNTEGFRKLRELAPDGFILYITDVELSMMTTGNFKGTVTDVLTLLSDLFRISVNLLLKLSPMADISMLITRLREHQGYVHEIHVVAAVGECKELLLWVRPEPCSRPRLFINENGHIIEADESSCDATPKFLHQDMPPITKASAMTGIAATTKNRP